MARPIMDYEDRESFDHPLIQVTAGLGMATSLTGLGLVVLLWSARVKSYRRRSA